MRFVLLIALLVSFNGIRAQPKKEKSSVVSLSKDSIQIRNAKKVWMMTYFRQRYPTRIEIDEKGKTVEVPLPEPMLIAKLHIALSTDGRHWMPLNNNEPVWDQFMRDPYVRRGPDGLWRVLATGGGGGKDREKVGPSCLYVTTKDLVHWQVEGTLPLMKDVRNDSGALARNIWAPEWFFDNKAKEYVLFWSSSFKDAGWKESRLYFSRTRDWKTFTPAKVLFQPPYSVIDGTLLEYNNLYYLFHKEEEFGARTGERRAIRLATAKNIEGPYSIHDGPLNKGQLVPVITEGPTVIKDPVKKGWLLYYDFPMTNDFGASYSSDLLHWNIEKDVRFPPDSRHGCISEITPGEARLLLNAYPNNKR